MPNPFIYEIRKEGEGSFIDITPLINSSDTTITDALCTTEWKSATNTASFSLRYADRDFFRTVLTYLLDARTAGKRVEVRITAVSTGKACFSGYLDDSSLEIASAVIPQTLSLSARDFITELDDSITEDIVLEGATVRTIVARLLQGVGYTGSLYSDLPESRTTTYFVVVADDEETYRDVIDTLLFECGGYVLYRNPATAGYEIRKIVPSTEPERIVHYVVADSLKTSAEIFDNDGIKVKWPTVSTKPGAVLYVSDIQTGIEDGELRGEEIQPGHYYPPDGDITATYQEYDSSLLDRAYQTSQTRKRNEDISLLYVKNAKVNLNPGTGWGFPILPNIGMEANPAFFPRKAWVLLRNDTSSPLDLLTFTIEGDAVYKSKLNTVRMPEGAKSPEDYETRFIFSDEEAVAFGNFYLNFRRLSSTVSTWTEKEPVSQLGEAVIVRHKGTEVAQAHVVVQINDESFSGGVRCRRVTAVSISGYSEYTWASESSTGSVVSKQVVSDTQQYYYSTSYEKLQDGTWLDAQLSDPVPGTALWVRRKITYTDGSVWLGDPMCVGAKPGADGKSPEYYYKYTDSDAPDGYKGGAALFIRGNAVLAVGATALIAGNGAWTPYVPEGPQYSDDFLWMKIVQPDGRVDIIPPAKKGEPAYGLEIIAEPASFQLTTRGVVKDDPMIISLTLKRHYVTNPAAWALSPSDKPDEIKLTVDSADGDKATVTIQKGAKIREFTVTADVGEHGVVASIVVSGIDGGVAEGHYFGVYPLSEDASLPTYNKDADVLNFGDAVFPGYVEGEGGLIAGDYIIFKTNVVTGEGESQNNRVEPIPYYWTGSTWAMLNSKSPIYSQSMGAMLADITSMSEMPVTTGAFYGFYRNLAAQYAFFTALSANEGFIESLTSNEAFIKLLTVLRLIVGTGTGLANSGFRARIGKFEDAEGNDVDIYDVMLGDKTIFKVFPDTGRVFIGQPNAEGNAPLSGFMYDPSGEDGTGTISTANNRLVISADGNITGNEASFSDTDLSGRVSTVALAARESEYPDVEYTWRNQYSVTMAKEIYELVSSSEFGPRIDDGYVRCYFTVNPVLPAAVYCALGFDGSTYFVDFYTGKFELITRSDDSYSFWPRDQGNVSNHSIYYRNDSDWRSLYTSSTSSIKFGTGNIVTLDIPGSPSDSLPGFIRKNHMYADENGFLRIRFLNKDGSLS